MSSDVELRGGAEVRRALRQVADDLDGDLGGAYTEIAARGARLTGQAAPRLTGRLAGSWTPRTGTAGKAEWSSRLPYAGVINRGGYHGIRGRRYVEAALKQLEREAPRIVEDGAREAIRGAGL